jgi:hypothetical protein
MSARGQLSFFDPAGELETLTDEARRLAEAEKLHRERERDLNRAIERARTAVEQFVAATEEIAADAERVEAARAGAPTVELLHGGDRVPVEAAGAVRLEDLLAERWATLSECAFEIRAGESGFTLTAAFRNDDGQGWLVPELQGPSSFLYRGDENGILLTDRTDLRFRAKFERYVAKDRDNADLRRKALTAITAKMARTAHAVIKTGTDYRPFFEAPMPSGRTPLSRSREGAAATL